MGFALIGGEKVFFLNAQKKLEEVTATPGTLLEIKNKRAAVATSSGIFSGSRVQIEDGEPESFAGFCRRKGFHPGDSLIR